MQLEYAFCSALSMRSFVQYVQFLLLNQATTATNNSTNSANQQTTYLMPYLYNSPSSSLNPLSSINGNQIIETNHHHHHPNHNNHNLTPIPSNTKDDLQTSGYLVLLFLIVFLLKTRGTKVII